MGRRMANSGASGLSSFQFITLKFAIFVRKKITKIIVCNFFENFLAILVQTVAKYQQPVYICSVAQQNTEKKQQRNG